MPATTVPPAPARDAAFEDHVQWARAAPIVWMGANPVEGRCTEDPLPWDFAASAGALIAAHRGPVLDVGTGDGRFFGSLGPLPDRSAATETWAPNLPVARRHLQPLGVDLRPVSADDGLLPFLDGRFSVALNRHEPFDPAEVLRVLDFGGAFLTEQVGSRDGIRMCAVLGEELPWDPQEVTAESLAAALTAAGFVIEDVDEHESLRTFSDLGAVLWFARTHPWFVPALADLSDPVIARYEAELRALHLFFASGNEFVDEAPRTLLRARRPR